MRQNRYHEHLEVSVLLPCRNAASTLPECIDSILAQTFTDYEIVAVDDASDDDSAVVLSNYSDSRLHIIRNDRPGLVNALNLGLAHCNAPLVARMDADAAATFAVAMALPA